MNVYFVGAEDIDFVGAVPPLGGSYYAAHVRGGFVTSGTPILSTLFASQNVVWAHAQWNVPNVQNTLNAYFMFLFSNNNTGNGGIGVIGTGVLAGQFKIVKRNNAGTVTTLATSSVAWNTGLQTADLYVNYSVSGQASLYIGGVLVADTGPGVDVTVDGAVGVIQLYMNAARSGTNETLSEIIVADSDTRSAIVWLLNSSTAGNAQTFSGTATNVNKATIADASFISAASVGLINEYKTGGIALPTGTFTVAAVKTVARALAGGGGPQTVEYVTRVGSTDYVGGSWLPPIGAFANDVQNYMQAVNPATGLAWVTADLTASTFNYGVESAA